jgi:small subunit ribosomal protein S17
MAQRIFVGQVIRCSCDKTAVVQVKKMAKHPLYNKNIIKIKSYAAHDSENAFKEGDWVRIRESRPLSKTKRWVIIGQAAIDESDPQSIMNKEVR